jgi:hypothetical protein
VVVVGEVPEAGDVVVVVLGGGELATEGGGGNATGEE